MHMHMIVLLTKHSNVHLKKLIDYIDDMSQNWFAHATNDYVDKDIVVYPQCTTQDVLCSC